MPLQKALETKHLILPTSKDLPETDQEWIDVKVGPIMGGDILVFDQYTDEKEFLADILISRIIDWNVKDLNGEVAEINIENLKRLSKEDLPFLLSEFLGGQGGEESDPKVETTLAA